MSLKDHMEKLPHFFEVARAGSIKGASEKLFITQPSITKSIKILESAIGKQLFFRLPRGMVVTPEGELLLRYCYEFFSQLNDIEVKLDAPNDPLAGSLKVGTYDSIAIYFWPKFLRKFLVEYPKLDLELTTGRSHRIQQMVETGELDLGLIIEPAESQHSVTVDLAQDSFKFYKSCKVEPVFASEASAPLIYMPDALVSGVKMSLEKALSSQAGSTRRRSYETSSLESAKELAVCGLGIALLPHMVAKSEVVKKNLVEVSLKGFAKEGVGNHRIGLVHSKHREDSELLTRLIAELKQQEWK